MWVMPGHADESVTVFLGYGRTRSGRVGTGVGFDAGWIRPLTTQWFGCGPRSEQDRRALAAGHHATPQARWKVASLVRIATLDGVPARIRISRRRRLRKIRSSLYPEVKYEGYAWGMAIDLNACTGCSACVVACQAENNIAVVGKRKCCMAARCTGSASTAITKASVDDPDMYYEPVPCMHCENAPCELVCPVAATVHSSEGLNEMVYNRCVGTRYCSNNCPYKVRRFNFLLFSDWDTPSLFGMRNPNVTCAAAA